LHLRAE